MLYSMETVAMTERLEKKIKTAELKMMRWVLGVMWKDRIKYRYIWRTAEVRRIGERLQGERLQWYRQVRRRKEYIWRWECQGRGKEQN